MNAHKHTGLARGHEVASIESEWRRIYGSCAEGSIDLAQRTGRSDPRRLTRIEAGLYLDVLRGREPFRSSAPPPDLKVVTRNL